MVGVEMVLIGTAYALEKSAAGHMLETKLP